MKLAKGRREHPARMPLDKRAEGVFGVFADERFEQLAVVRGCRGGHGHLASLKGH